MQGDRDGIGVAARARMHPCSKCAINFQFWLAALTGEIRQTWICSEWEDPFFIYFIYIFFSIYDGMCASSVSTSTRRIKSSYRCSQFLCDFNLNLEGLWYGLVGLPYSWVVQREAGQGDAEKTRASAFCQLKFYCLIQSFICKNRMKKKNDIKQRYHHRPQFALKFITSHMLCCFVKPWLYIAHV